MKPILYSATETNFTSNGFGRLSDAISCNVHEVLNGVYELTMVYPVEGIHFSDLQEHRIIYAVHDETGEPQPFEIYRISRPLNRRVTVNAAHISYRLNKAVVNPFTANGVQTAMMDLVSEAVVPHGFTFVTDKTTVANMNVTAPVAIRTIMGGVQGSVIDVYGGEWEFDHFACTLRNRRGQDSGVNIRYGKNLTDITKTTDATNLWTGIVPYWTGTDDSNEQTSVVYDGVIYSDYRNLYPYDMIIAVDATSAFEAEPTQAQLATWGQTYVRNNAKQQIPLSVDISFVQLWQTEEYKDVAPLQRLHIGDTVSVFYEVLGVDDVARITEYTYNVLLERYDSMTIGDVRTNLATAVSQDIKDATKDLPSKTFIEIALDRATDLITGGLGGHVVINTNEAGQPNEILVMNTADKATATRVMRINYQGIAFGTGYNGPFNSAWTTLDGTFDAQFINVIHLTAAAITTGILKDQANKNFWNMDTGEFQLAATTTVGGSTVQSIANSAASTAVANQTQQSIFNKLTNNGQTQGIYLSNGKLYINADYIQSGHISANRIQGGTFTAGGANNVNGQILVKDANGATVCTLNKDGIDAKGILSSTMEATYIPQTVPATPSRTVNLDLILRYGKLSFWAEGNKRGTIGMPDRSNSDDSASFSFASPVPSEMPLTVTLPSDGSFVVATRSNMTIPVTSTDGSGFHVNQGYDATFEGDISLSGGGDFTLDSGNFSAESGYYGKANISLNRQSGVRSGANITVDGNITASGTKSRLADTESYGKKLFYAYETATPYFGDIGIGKTSEDGECIISIDDIVTETTRTDLAYCVFLQAEGNGSLYIAEKTVSYFIVKGTPNTSFSWEVKARQTGFEELRTESMEEDPEMQQDLTELYENDLNNIINIHETDLAESVLNLTKEADELYETA